MNEDDKTKWTIHFYNQEIDFIDKIEPIEIEINDIEDIGVNKVFNKAAKITCELKIKVDEYWNMILNAFNAIFN